MRTRLTAIAALAVIAATLAAVAAAGPGARTSQDVAIKLTDEPNGGGFRLTPLTPGTIRSDSGTVSFCCWTQRFITRNGQTIQVNNPQMTLTGKRALGAVTPLGGLLMIAGWIALAASALSIP